MENSEKRNQKSKKCFRCDSSLPIRQSLSKMWLIISPALPITVPSLGWSSSAAIFLASFSKKDAKEFFCGQKSLSIRRAIIRVAPFPPEKPKDEGYKFVLSNVPMRVTGKGVLRALEQADSTKFLFERYDGTPIRTGRVIFWSPRSELPNFMIILGCKCSVKRLQAPVEKKKKDDQAKDQKNEQKEQKEQKERRKEKGKEKEKMDVDPDFPPSPTHQVLRENPRSLVDVTTPPAQSPKKRKIETSPLSKNDEEIYRSALERPAPRVTMEFLKKIGLPVPQNHATLSVYEELKKEEDAIPISNEVPSPIGKVKKKAE